jgi:predicted MFS family arabinose efflux permease
MIDSHAASASTPAPTTEYWSGVFAMTLCVFTLIASEFMPVSLLTPMAADFGVSEGWIGQGIAISGAFAVITSLLIPVIAGRWDRKWFLIAMTALMCVSSLIIAMAPHFSIYMAGRVLIGIAIGGFWSMSAATAMRLVDVSSVPKAMAVFNGGNALAMIIAAPLGSYLGSVIGWRGAFFCIAPIALIALVWQFISLPKMKESSEVKGFGASILALKNRYFVIGLIASGLFFMGQFSLFTYVRPYLENITQVNAETVSLILLVIGICGFIGTTCANRFIRAGLYGTLIVIPFVMAIMAALLIAYGQSLWIVVVALGVWGFSATAAPVAWWSWLAKTLPDNAEAGGGLMVAMIQLSIALGSTTGGVLYDAFGHGLTFAFGALLLVLASLLTRQGLVKHSPHRR